MSGKIPDEITDEAEEGAPTRLEKHEGDY